MNKSKAQLFIEGLVSSALSLIKVLILSKLSLRFPSRINNECVILANGPSLNSFLESTHEFVKNKDVVCVNFFSRTEAFTKVKPAFYIMTAPEYFLEDEKSGWTPIRDKTFEALCEKTDWPLILLVPYLAKKKKRWSILMQD